MFIIDRDAFNQCNGNFMQSTEWSNVKTNWIPEYVSVSDHEGNITAAMLILVKKIPLLRTALLYVPRGPVCDFHDKNTFELLWEKTREIAKKYRAYCLKMDPLIDENDRISIDNLTSLGFIWHKEKVGYDNIQCRENYVLDIDGRSSEQIFKSFKSKHRYNIRLSQKKGVTCHFYGEEKLDDFYDMMKITGKRDKFNIRSKEYFLRILRSFNGMARLCMCYYENIPLSGALCIEYAGVMSYVYGCSSDTMKNYMPNYLMQWTMIKYCAEQGLKQYDFCGIPYWYDKNHRNYGVYRFKEGFNGTIKTYAGEFDYTYRKNIMKCTELCLKMKRWSIASSFLALIDRLSNRSESF